MPSHTSPTTPQASPEELATGVASLEELATGLASRGYQASPLTPAGAPPHLEVRHPRVSVLTLPGLARAGVHGPALHLRLFYVSGHPPRPTPAPYLCDTRSTSARTGISSTSARTGITGLGTSS
jgi:hypothetical protein